MKPIFILLLLTGTAYAQGLNYDDDTYWAMRADKEHQREARQKEQGMKAEMFTCEYNNEELSRKNIELQQELAFLMEENRRLKAAQESK